MGEGELYMKIILNQVNQTEIEKLLLGNLMGLPVKNN